MNLKRIFLVLIISLVLISTGCSNETIKSVSPNFDAEPDLSLYVIEDEQSSTLPVELDPNLEYIDTHQLTILMDGVSATSSTRKSYSDYMSEWNFVLVDARPYNTYEKGHINGAINIPDSEFNKYSSRLPENKDTLIIFYCGGLSCELSANSAKKAIELGYTNVKVYQEGEPAWKAEGNYLVVTEDYVNDLIMETYMSRTDLVPYYILDSRPYSMYFKSHIPNAITVDNTQYLARYSAYMPKDKNTLIITYCNGFDCSKSHTLAQDLINDGYTNVKVFAGGMPSWNSINLPTFGMEGIKTNFDVSAGKVSRGLTTDQFVDKLNNLANVVVLDVRTDDERSHGGIDGSIHIPDSEIHADPNAIKDQLPTDKNTTILIHCASGARASGVVDKIADLGYPNTFYLDHSITIDADGNYSF
ncbi:MAG: rhodanese-like domain-containing protein [Vulcanibacillus sp.]